jgi:hypothetical protein
MIVGPDESTTTQNNITRIAKELLSGRIGFLFGSGMSTPSGGINGKDLAYRLIKDGLFPGIPSSVALESSLREVASKYPLEAIAAGVRIDQTFQSAGFTKMLREVSFPNGPPAQHDGHRELAKIIAKIRTIRMLFTTNWDSLLEEAVGQGQALEVSAKNQDKYIFDIEDHKLKNVLVIHLHGTFDDPIICENEVMNVDTSLYQLFMGELMTKCFVFVGYSLSDPDTRAIYYRVSDILTRVHKDFGKTTYIVSPPSNEEDRLVSDCIWEARHATYIPLGAEEFFVSLNSAIAAYALGEMKEQLRKRLGLSSMDLIDQRIEEIMKVFPDLGSTEKALLYLYSMTK